MSSDKEAAYALGFLEHWAEEDKTVNSVPTLKKELLKHIKMLDDTFKYYRASRAKLLAEKSALENAKLKKENPSYGSNARAVLEEDFERRTNKLMIRIYRADGSDYSPCRALHNGVEPHIEMPPFPKAYAISLSELKAIVRVLEENAKSGRLPQEVVA